MTLKKSGIAAVTLCSLLMTSSPSHAYFNDPLTPQERCERVVNLLQEGKGSVHYARGIDDEYCPSKRLEEAYTKGVEPRFNNILRLIKNGNTGYAPLAFGYAKGYSLDLELVEQAIELGRPKEFDRILGAVRGGTTTLYPIGQELVDEYGFSQKRLDEALKIGVVREYQKLTRLIERGIPNIEHIRERLVQRFSLDEKELLASIATPQLE